jgi:cold shock CspA family protein
MKNDNKRYTGTVCHDRLATKGFAFAKVDDYDGPDLFVHHSTVKGAGIKLKEGDRISFEIAFDQRGRTRAENVRLLEAA